jgi:hypothetical protein
MRQSVSITLAVLFILCICSRATAERFQASADKQFIGAWAGSWEGGGGSGKIEVTIAKDDAGKFTGKVAVSTDGGDYTADFKSLAFEGNKMTAKYDFPFDEQGEVVLTATFESASLKGSWSLRSKSDGNEMISGTWTATRKSS